MLSELFNSLVAWVGDHPVAAGIVIFLIAFCDAVIILGAVVPALPLLFAIGVLIGLGEISGPYAVACAAIGAMAGDGVSYWVGHRWAMVCGASGRSASIRSCSTAAKRCSAAMRSRASWSRVM